MLLNVEANGSNSDSSQRNLEVNRGHPMATTYLSAAAAAAAAANYHHYEQEAVAMNLVNSAPHSAAAAAAASAAAAGYCSSPREANVMHEMKYNPPNSNTPPNSTSSSVAASVASAIAVTSPLHNGHPALAAAHNPWGLPGPHDPWAMHPMYSAAASNPSPGADLKPQDIKPHSPGDFNSVQRHMAPWQHPPSSPYLSMPQTASGASGAPPLAPNSPSPHHPYGPLNGVMPPHHYVDRYSRESHNSSPRSGTDEDPMQPTSGTGTGMALELTTENCPPILNSC